MRLKMRYLLKVIDKNKWISKNNFYSSERVSLADHDIKLVETILVKFDDKLVENEKLILNNWLEKVKEIIKRKNFPSFLIYLDYNNDWFFNLSIRYVTNINDAMILEVDLKEYKIFVQELLILAKETPKIKEILNQLKSNFKKSIQSEKLFSPVILGEYEYIETFAEKISEKFIIKALVNLSEVELEPIDDENRYIVKKGFVIFKDERNKKGYIDKSGIPSEISSARLFDSEFGALKSIKSQSIRNYVISEAEIKITKPIIYSRNFKSDLFDKILILTENERLNKSIICNNTDSIVNNEENRLKLLEIDTQIKSLEKQKQDILNNVNNIKKVKKV